MSALRFERVSRAGRFNTLSEVDFSAGPGELVVVFGTDGSGKHTLLRLAAGLERPDSGAVRRPKTRVPAGWVAEDGGLLSNLSLLDNAILPLMYHGGVSEASARQRARAAFDALGILRYARRRPVAANHHVRRLAQLARARLAEPGVYLLEEPLEGIPARARKAVEAELQAILAEKRAPVVVMTGNPKAYLSLASLFIYLDDGNPRYFAGRSELLSCGDPDVLEFMK